MTKHGFRIININLSYQVKMGTEYEMRGSIPDNVAMVSTKSSD